MLHSFRLPLVFMSNSFLSSLSSRLMIARKSFSSKFAVVFSSLPFSFLKFHYLIENEKGEKLSEANTAQAVIEMKSLQTCFEMPEALKKALKAYNEKEKR